jgi:hypothetical protein
MVCVIRGLSATAYGKQKGSSAMRYYLYDIKSIRLQSLRSILNAAH